MKTRTTFLLILLASLATGLIPALHAETPRAKALIVRVNQADFNGWEIVPGITTSKVLGRCGEPDTRLSETIWIYGRFHADSNQPDIKACTSLMLTFTEDKLTTLHLIGEPAEKIIVARLRSNSPVLVTVDETSPDNSSPIARAK